MENLEKLSTLNDDESLKLEWKLRQELLTSPGLGEQDVQSLEKHHGAQRALQFTAIEKIDISCEEMRRVIASKRLEIKKCSETIRKRSCTNEELRRQIQKQIQAAQKARDLGAAQLSALETMSESKLAHVSAEITSPPEAIETDTIAERLKLDECESKVHRLREEHYSVMAALDQISAELLAVTHARSDLHRNLENREAAQTTFEAANSAKESTDAASAIAAAKTMSQMLREMSDKRHLLCTEVTECEAMLRHLSEGVQERTETLYQLRKKSFSTLNVPSYRGSIHHEAGEKAAYENLIAENRRLSLGLLDVLKESAAERVAQAQFGAILRDRIAESCIRLQQELYELENARNIQSGAIRRNNAEARLK